MKHQNMTDRFYHFSHSMPEMPNAHKQNPHLQMTLIKQPTPDDMHITQHCSEQQTHHMSNKAFIIRGGQVGQFMVLFLLSIIIMANTTLL